MLNITLQCCFFLFFFWHKLICTVLECHLSTLFGRPKALVASVCHSCLFILSYTLHRVDISGFFSEINGELMIPLFPRCARKGGFGILFLIAQPLETDWSRKNTPSPLLPGLTMEALIFLIGFYAVRGPAGIRSGLIILNKAKPLGLSVCLLFPMLSQWSVCSPTHQNNLKTLYLPNEEGGFYFMGLREHENILI